MKSLMIAAGAAMLLGGCATNARDSGMAGPAAMAMSEAARMYMRMASSGDMFEIESSRLALQMSRNEAVRSFAQMMIADHTRMSNEMMEAARQAGLEPPPMQMAPHHADMLNRLRAAGPNQFDMMYHDAQVAAHQEALNLHRGYASAGDNPTLRALAARAAPAVEMHLGQLQTHGTHMRTAPMQPQPQAEPPRRRAGERG
ncbi:MAG: DUF4142 domain-containing protein [Allosphingosinicella sp.]|uniref:DUF4142 domain-containing protein n=1 Tax=Allosphingosinicella sp. TaxID=2823234 RepID=UPI003933C1C9